MNPPLPRPFAYAPLRPYVARLGVRETYRILRISWATHADWRAHGLTVVAADTAAVRLELHPSSIWPEWVDIGIADQVDAIFGQLRRELAIHRPGLSESMAMAQGGHR